MFKGPHHDPEWVAWPGNAAVEYKIEDDILKIRHWRNGVPTISSGELCSYSAEDSIRHQLSLLRQQALLDDLPPLPEKEEDDPPPPDLLARLLNSLLAPLGPFQRADE